jgi:hypothetical protein
MAMMKIPESLDFVTWFNVGHLAIWPKSGGAWNFVQFPDFFGWSTIKINGKTQKLSNKHVSGGERARRAGISLEKI